MDVYLAEAKERRQEYIDITFQNGPIQEVGLNGCEVEDVIDLLVERLRGFNQGNLRCRENSVAIARLEEAGSALLARLCNRVAQGVEGTNLPHES